MSVLCVTQTNTKIFIFLKKWHIRGPYNLKINIEFKINFSRACLKTVFSSSGIQWSYITLLFIYCIKEVMIHVATVDSISRQ